MTEDAKFEDGDDRPLKLIAADTEDLQVISALVQDAVLPASEMKYEPSKRRFVLLLNRFRWEDQSRAAQRRRAYERVRSILMFEDVAGVSSQGIQRDDPETVFSLLSIGWEAREDGVGQLVLTLAGDGAIALDVECVNVTLQDVTRPYVAPSGKAPEHPE
ncbi:DUF2948 family protein [Litoreibacter roseus]|uniref:DUF2948 family protein n=1 Tax=Litoreibacter roseus TaxID=2601869 RepID=A0A6N6JH34_9RHOB|nr:DUF2948 family protein [Litoreibacter roseus]GFE65536.1 hypothetical protein KIN_26100 [Litoreibacter roseus]